MTAEHVAASRESPYKNADGTDRIDEEVHAGPIDEMIRNALENNEIDVSHVVAEKDRASTGDFNLPNRLVVGKGWFDTHASGDEHYIEYEIVAPHGTGTYDLGRLVAVVFYPMKVIES